MKQCSQINISKTLLIYNTWLDIVLNAVVMVCTVLMGYINKQIQSTVLKQLMSQIDNISQLIINKIGNGKNVNDTISNIWNI